MTKYVLAPDSFKESMTAAEVCQAMVAGIKKVDPTAKIISVPMADGGEGTVDSMVAATHGQKIYQTVTGPLGKKIKTYYVLLGDKSTAVIEMAKASGLELVPQPILCGFCKKIKQGHKTLAFIHQKIKKKVKI